MSAVDWGAVDAWFEEDEQVFGHPRNPYHRVDCLRSERRLRVEAAGADTGRHRPTPSPSTRRRWTPGSTSTLATCAWTCSERSSTTTYCPYKGTASYWTARIGDEVVDDIAWSYEDPLPESAPLGQFLSFDDTRVTVQHDLPPAG